MYRFLVNSSLLFGLVFTTNYGSPIVTEIDRIITPGVLSVFVFALFQFKDLMSTLAKDPHSFMRRSKRLQDELVRAKNHYCWCCYYSCFMLLRICSQDFLIKYAAYSHFSSLLDFAGNLFKLYYEIKKPTSRMSWFSRDELMPLFPVACDNIMCEYPGLFFGPSLVIRLC